MILDSLENKKKNIFLKYAFVNAFLNDAINEKTFVANLIKFKRELISKGITESNINSLKYWYKTRNVFRILVNSFLLLLNRYNPSLRFKNFI